MTTYTAENWQDYLNKINGHDVRDLCVYTPKIQDLNDRRQLNDYDRGVWYVLQQLIEDGSMAEYLAEQIFLVKYCDLEFGTIKDRERLCWWLVTQKYLTFDEADYMVDGLTLLEARHLINADPECGCSICED
jgi:hypothetical protein